MSYPQLPSNGETSWGDKFRTWANALEGRKVEGSGMTLRYDTTAGTRVLLDHPDGTITLSYDSGWRDITSLLTINPDYFDLEGSPAPKFRVKRVNEHVWWRFEARAKSSLPTNIAPLISGIPLGFRINVVYGSFYDGSNISGEIGAFNGSGTAMTGKLSPSAAGRITWGAGVYPCNDSALPTTLPGTP